MLSLTWLIVDYQWYNEMILFRSINKKYHRSIIICKWLHVYTLHNQKNMVDKNRKLNAFIVLRNMCPAFWTYNGQSLPTVWVSVAQNVGISVTECVKIAYDLSDWTMSSNRVVYDRTFYSVFDRQYEGVFEWHFNDTFLVNIFYLLFMYNIEYQQVV